MTAEPGADTSVRMFMRPLAAQLDRPGVQEVCVNRPGELFVEDERGWARVEAPELTALQLRLLARAVATYTGQDVCEERPLLAATLPGGERIQIALPPAAETLSLTIRRPSTRVFTLAELADQGLFAATEVLADTAQALQAAAGTLDATRRGLLELLWGARIAEFMRAAVAARLTIVVSGATGSGKTTLMKALVQECDPAERLVTIEDAREIALPRHPNAVHLLYSQGGQGVARVSARQLLTASLRMRPDRILLAEIREGECYEFLRNAASGHPGSLTSVHAGSCAQAFEQMALMLRQSPAGAGLSHEEARRLLELVVDVVVHTTRGPRGRQASQVWYRPLRQQQAGAA